MKNHSLFATLRSLRGNPRGCVYFEPLWGIPFNLYAPYVSIYMIALGMSEKQIGLIVSISWVFQIFLALISVSLGVLNLLPLPVLDGGHLMYYLWEGVTGKPVSDVWMERLQRGGVAMLLLMMSIALFNDFTRLFG